MEVLPLKESIIYGPINSRRLGRSLGINLLPTRYKLCSFDCIYCHYGRTRVKTLTAESEHFPGVREVLDAVREALMEHRYIDYITFSGNGEPTIHPQFPLIAREVRRLRDELRPDVKLAILSNSTTVHNPAVRETLGLFDAPIMKLDAGDFRTMAAINRPAPGVKLEQIIAGLREVPRLIVQSVLIDGRASNIRGQPFEAWLAALTEVKPTLVQIYSTDRPVAEAGVEKVPPAKLQRIAEEITRRTGLRVKAYWPRS